MEGYNPYVDANAVMRAGDPGLNPALQAQELGIRMDEERRQRAAQEKRYQEEQLLRAQENNGSAAVSKSDLYAKVAKMDAARAMSIVQPLEQKSQEFFEINPNGKAADYVMHTNGTKQDVANLLSEAYGIQETSDKVSKELEKDVPYLNAANMSRAVIGSAIRDKDGKDLPLENGAGRQRVVEGYDNILKDRKAFLPFYNEAAADEFAAKRVSSLFPTGTEQATYMRGGREWTKPVKFVKEMSYYDPNTDKIQVYTDPDNASLMHPAAFDFMVHQPGLKHRVWATEAGLTQNMEAALQNGTEEQKAKATAYLSLDPEQRDRYVAMNVWNSYAKRGEDIGKENPSEAQKVMDDERKERKQDVKDAFSRSMQIANFNASNAERAYQHNKDKEDKTGYTEAGAGLVSTMMGNFGIDPGAHGLPKATLPLVKMPITRATSPTEKKALQYMGFGGQASATGNARMFIFGDYLTKPADLEGYAAGGTPGKSRSLLGFAPATGEMVLYNAPNVKGEDGSGFGAPVQQGAPINLYTGDENDLAQAKTLLINQGIYAGLGTVAATRKADDIMNGILFTKQEYQRQRTQKTSPPKTTTK